MHKAIKSKWGLELVTSCSQVTKQLKKTSFVTYDDYVKRFLIVSKVTSANLCQPIRDIINYSTSICTFESGEFRKEGKTYKNLNISRIKRAF